jgi:hypothetical protein
MTDNAPRVSAPGGERLWENARVECGVEAPGSDFQSPRRQTNVLCRDCSRITI